MVVAANEEELQLILSLDSYPKLPWPKQSYWTRTGRNYLLLWIVLYPHLLRHFVNATIACKTLKVIAYEPSSFRKRVFHELSYRADFSARAEKSNSELLFLRVDCTYNQKSSKKLSNHISPKDRFIYVVAILGFAKIWRHGKLLNILQ